MGEGTSSLQTALEMVESLSLDEQGMLLDIVYHRIIERRRAHLVKEVAEAREAYRHGGAVRMRTLVWSPSRAAHFWAAWQAGGGDCLAIREQLFAEETVATLFDKVLAYQEGNDSSQK